MCENTLMSEPYVKRIETAQVYDVAKKTPLEHAPQLSERLDNHILIKREDLQPVYSFKLRGAYNKLRKLPEAQRQQGVIAASAGNHAQGVALAARKLQMRATIVMPRTTPDIKVDAVKRLGGKVVLFGDNYDEASGHAIAQAKKTGQTYIPPYDDKDVIAGQGTVGMEILEQYDGNIDAVYVPVGGGGFVAGIAAYIKSVNPKVKIIGVEPDDAACMKAALEADRRVVLKTVGQFADGVAVKQVGKEPFRLARLYVDEVITANVDEISAAVRDIFQENRSVAEPAGALALAGLKNHVAQKGLSGKTLVVIESGANVNFDRLGHITERAELGEHREALMAVTIPEQPGSFKRFCSTIGKRGITEFNYRYADTSEAHIFVGVKLKGEAAEKEKIIKTLQDKGYPVADMSSDELARAHVRHMVGGRAAVDDETLFRFQFPERPGALMEFLNRVGQRWNISLFHYRNHGAAVGRVLVGLQVPHGEKTACRQALDELGYSYWPVVDSKAYELFLSPLGKE